jgi:hypothetical protein
VGAGDVIDDFFFKFRTFYFTSFYLIRDVTWGTIKERVVVLLSHHTTPTQIVCTSDFKTRVSPVPPPTLSCVCQWSGLSLV